MSQSFTPALIKILREAGCTFQRHGKGDHDIWYSPISDRRFVVDSVIKSKHTSEYCFKASWIT
jgi:hypothetical protein